MLYTERCLGGWQSSFTAAVFARNLSPRGGKSICLTPPMGEFTLPVSIELRVEARGIKL